MHLEARRECLYLRSSVQAEVNLADFFGKRHVCYCYSCLKHEAQLMLTNLRDAFRGQSRSPNIVPFRMLGRVSYCAIVTLSLARAVFQIFDFKKCHDLEMGSKVTQGH